MPLTLTAAPANKVEFVFSDNLGKTARVAFWVDSTYTSITDGAIVALIDAVNALSDLFIRSVLLKNYAVPTTPGTPLTGDQDHAEEKAMMVFESAGGEFRTMLPAPGAVAGSIFGSDHETVDTTVAAVGAYISYMLAHALDCHGLPLLRFVRGYRMAPAGRKSHG